MRRRSAPRLPLFASALALSLLACGGDGGDDGDASGPPCEDDLLLCESGEPLQPDPACTLEGELSFELGNAEGSFTPLAPGETPTTITGNQGGWHTWLGVRVLDPALDYPGVEVRVDLLECYDDCEAEDAAFEQVRSRTVVSPGVEANGAVEVTDILFVWWSDWFGVSSSDRWRLEVTVRDRCGREGSLSHQFAPPT